MDSPLVQVLLGAAAGVLSGLGIGGGAILMIFFTLFGDVPQTRAQGINLLFFLPTAATALCIHLRERRVDGKAALFAALTGACAAAAASLAARSVDPQLLKKGLGLLLLAVGVKELLAKRAADDEPPAGAAGQDGTHPAEEKSAGENKPDREKKEEPPG